MLMLGDAHLGAWTFLASPHSADMCGINGLPLTPNSIRVLGRFQRLKTLKHPKLCRYLDIIRGRHERLMIVSEHYANNLKVQSHLKIWSDKELSRIIFDCLDALAYLHTQGLVHRCLSPSCILFNKQGMLKMSNFGLYDMTEFGSTVPFAIGIPDYMSPECLLLDCKEGSNFEACPPKTDVWSLALIILEIILGRSLWKECTLQDIFFNTLKFLDFDSGSKVIDWFVSEHGMQETWKRLNPNLKRFLESALHPCISKRCGSMELLSHPFFSEHSRVKVFHESFPSAELRCNQIQDKDRTSVAGEELSKCPMEAVYSLWQLAGGDVEAELRKQGLVRAKPSICSITNLVLEDGEEFGERKDFLMDDTVVLLSLDPLKQRLKDLDPRTYYPILEFNCLGPKSNYSEESLKLPVVIREKDIEYQLNRIILVRRLLLSYPYKRTQIVEESRKDIAPLYRAKIWAALLNIQGDVQGYYQDADKDTPTPTDRQIEVDIPRCHQYNELLASPVGHGKFKRILKAWVISHPQYVYWQGLDSLCAPFLHLNFNDEALAFACLKAFISKYLNHFFLKDNSPVIQEYLRVFSQLIAFHDPQLSNHLDGIGFIPELYSIPWFLTMYTHVFPLHKIFHLWDTLLLGDGSFPLCIALSILKQLRNNLLSFGFNECILLFSDMPEIDMEKCVKDSIAIFRSTPKSATFRQHEFNDTVISSPLGMNGIATDILKLEVSPRISAEELLDLNQKSKLLFLDVRPTDEYLRGCYPESLNMPFQLEEMQSLPPGIQLALSQHKGRILVVAGSARNNHASQFANMLVRQGCFSRVCILHNGIDVLRTTGILVLGAENNYPLN